MVLFFPRAALTPVPGWRAKCKSHDRESVAFFCITEDSLREKKQAAFTILTICFLAFDYAFEVYRDHLLRCIQFSSLCGDVNDNAT